MPFLALPAVLVRSLMHSLQVTEIASLARCSQWTLHCADSAFAWRHCPPMKAQLPYSPVPYSRLLLWLSLSLTLSVECSPLDLPVEELLPTLLVLSQRSRVVELRPSFAAKPIRKHEQPVRDMVRLIAQLPHLTSLILCGSINTEQFTPLLCAPALTALDMVARDPALLALISQLPHLRILSLAWTLPVAGLFVGFCTSPPMAALESLSMHRWNIKHVSVDEFAAGFAALTSLHTLELSSVEPLRSILPHVRHASRLRRLICRYFSGQSFEALLLSYWPQRLR